MSDESQRPTPESEPDDLPYIDPRDEPAEFGLTVGLVTAGAVIVAAITMFFGSPEAPGGVKWLLLGPIALMAGEVLVHELWWRRWWGLLPGAAVGLLVYFEGRHVAADILGVDWGHAAAYVLAWVLFAVVFVYASRWPQTNFSAEPRPGRPA
ncbi:hypothetical protein [Sinosporangium siamense]|uniref:Uncharacterized protein n=1 Tax=Sinosporangium siamense TaxID=1367973 RepID=A0A919RK93_9ACTN|nr:hypothetical protein [Sinosporangium siamense]GII93459.1 hypothetical protein Ssi02_36900 [Sinosporangium siamense]